MFLWIFPRVQETHRASSQLLKEGFCRKLFEEAKKDGLGFRSFHSQLAETPCLAWVLTAMLEHLLYVSNCCTEQKE